MNEEIIQEACQELRTIGDFVRWAASQFDEAGLYYGHGTTNAWDEAAMMVLSTLNLPPDSQTIVYSCALTTCEKNKLCANIKRRIVERIPAAYILNEAWFSGMNFYVDERVLVPRSPLAELIMQRFSPWLDEKKIERIADVCTGSGCIACALASYFPEALVDALDISQDALDVANKNIDQHGLESQVSAIYSDLLSAVLNERYDLIVSNPPYVSQALMETLPSEFLKEPRLGLEGGLDGIDLIKPLLVQAKQCLNPEGVVVVEVGLSQMALEAYYPKVPFLWLDFAQGGEGIFLLTKTQLDEYF